MLTENNVALATAAGLILLGVGSVVYGPTSTRPVERPAVMAQRPLWVPVEGVGVDQLADSFGAPRSEGRKHKGIDIFAPQGTPVRATAAGTIAGLHLVGKGGIAVYEIDETGKYAYYYAHLNGYAPDLKDGMKVAQGQVIGYVGKTGNAATTAPHLHFQIQWILPGTRWWQGPAIDPYPALMEGRVTETQPPPAPVVVAGMSDAAHLASMTTGSTSSVRPASGTKRGTRKYQP